MVSARRRAVARPPNTNAHARTRARSPLGTYLVTIHRQGIALWGGPSWKRIARLMHPSVEVRLGLQSRLRVCEIELGFCVCVFSFVQTIEFSPCEKYVVTIATVENDDPADPRAIVIWDVVRLFVCLFVLSVSPPD